MLEPVPYAEMKATYGRKLIGEARWLGAFGDSAFDADMLQAAEVRVAVRPKPGLRAQAERLQGLVQLRPR
jgi:phosphoserine phosphatase